MPLSGLGENSLQILRDAGFLKGMYIPTCLGQPVHVVSLFDEEEAHLWGRPGKLALAFEYKGLWFWIVSHCGSCTLNGPAEKGDLAYHGHNGYPFMAIKKRVRWWVGKPFFNMRKLHITDEEALDRMIMLHTKEILES